MVGSACKDMLNKFTSCARLSCSVSLLESASLPQYPSRCRTRRWQQCGQTVVHRVADTQLPCYRFRSSPPSACLCHSASVSLPQAARPAAIHGNNFILLPLVGSRRVETCKSSTSVMHTACPLGKILRLLSTLKAQENVDDAFTIVASAGNCAKACTKNRAE